MRKLLIVISILLLGYSGNVFAEVNEVGSGTLTHFGVSIMRLPDKTVSHSLQINGSLFPSIEKEMPSYSNLGKRGYGYIQVSKNNGYGFGLGYYLGRIGTVGVQAGIWNYNNTQKDDFVYGIYFDFNVAKFLLQKLATTI